MRGSTAKRAAFPMNEIASTGQLKMSLARWVIVLAPLLMLLGILSGLMGGSGDSNRWYQSLAKPGFVPPGWLFGVVWPLLYILQAFALALVLDARGASKRGRAVMLFIIQFGLGLLWTPLFFAAHKVEAASWVALAMAVSALAAMLAFWRIRSKAGLLMVPLLLWLVFACVMTFSLARLNPDAERLHNPVARTHIGAASS